MSSLLNNTVGMTDMKSLSYGIMRVLAGMAVVSCMLASCSGNSHSDVIKVVSERDSLRNVTAAQGRWLEKVNTVLTTLNSALDSVQQQEGMIFININGEGTASRADALSNLDRFEAVVRSQKHRIDQLEAQLKAHDELDEPESRSLEASTLITNLRAQLAQKDQQIAELRKELEKKNVDIEKLRATVSAQNTRITQLDEQNKRYSTALTRQSDMMNVGYVAMGSKKDLEAKGIIKKGRIVTTSALDRSKFRQIDIRKFTEITFEARKPRIITDAPKSTYSLTTNGDGQFTLHIHNPTDFWSISNFLVIQTR